MALSAARVSMSYGTSATSAEQSLLLLIPALLIAVISWLTMLPTLAATLGARLSWLIVTVVLAIVFCLIGSLASLLDYSIVPASVYGCLAVAGAVLFLGLAAPLLFARSLGYRLHTGRR